jgi:primosomal replication protein N
MNNVFVSGEVSEIKALDKATFFTLTAVEFKKNGDNFDKVEIPLSVLVSGKQVEFFNNYIKEGGNVIVTGALAQGKKGLYVRANKVEVGRFGPRQENAEKPKSNNNDDDLPF